MSKRVSLYLFPCVLGVAVVVLACFCGCDRGDTAGGSVPRKVGMMEDEGFRAEMKEQVKKRKELAGVRARLVEKMELMVDEMKAKMPGADDAAVKAALEKVAEWNSLYKKVVDINTAIEDNQRKSTRIVGRKMKEQKEISK